MSVSPSFAPNNPAMPLPTAQAVLGLSALQLVWLVVSPIVTSLQLDTDQGCYLNLLPGQVCE